MTFHSAMITIPEDADKLTYRQVLARNGINLPPLTDILDTILAAKTDDNDRREIGDIESARRQRPGHVGRYDQIAGPSRPSGGDNPPPAPQRRRQRRRPRPIPLNSNHPGIAELHRDYVGMGWTADEYAEHLGITRKQLWEYFNDIRFPSVAVRERIKARTGTDVGETPSRRRHPFFRNAGDANRRVRGDIPSHRETIDRINRKPRP